MTERLSQLLHDEATHVSAPPPDPARLAVDGRRLRRRRQLTHLAAGAAVVLLAGGSVVGWQGLDDDRRPDVAAEVPRDAVIYGWEDRVHLDDASVEMQGSVAGLALTARGVLAVSHAPEELTLVRYDGSTVDLGPAPDTRIATDPGSEVYVHTEGRGDSLTVVVSDAATGDLVREVAVPPEARLGDRRPGLSLEGDTAYLGFGRSGVIALDLTTGDVRRMDLTTAGLPAIRSGRAVLADPDAFRVVDLSSGETLLRVRFGGVVEAALSPDAGFLLVARETMPPRGVSLEDEYPPEVTIHRIGSGESVELDRADSGTGGWAWTLGGEAYRIDGDEVLRCDPGTGACERSPAPEPLPDYAVPALPAGPTF